MIINIKCAKFYVYSITQLNDSFKTTGIATTLSNYDIVELENDSDSLTSDSDVMILNILMHLLLPKIKLYVINPTNLEMYLM